MKNEKYDAFVARSKFGLLFINSMFINYTTAALFFGKPELNIQERVLKFRFKKIRIDAIKGLAPSDDDDELIVHLENEKKLYIVFFGGRDKFLGDLQNLGIKVIERGKI